MTRKKLGCMLVVAASALGSLMAASAFASPTETTGSWKIEERPSAAPQPSAVT
jgi:hypothetical protein